MLMPTSSEQWDVGWSGMYPVKIYTVDGVLIYQHNIGDDNTGKTPLGGVIVQGSAASSMAISIANPITYYAGSGAVINQTSHSGDLFNYYWTSYSRGTDGRHASNNEPSWHNAYLDGYIPLRAKSIYDPCPYLYRIPSNGTWNQFKSNPGWTQFSYLGGVSWNLNTLGESWFPGLGKRQPANFVHPGRFGWFLSSTSFSQSSIYVLMFSDSKSSINPSRNVPRSYGHSVRCIDFVALYEP